MNVLVVVVVFDVEGGGCMSEKALAKPLSKVLFREPPRKLYREQILFVRMFRTLLWYFTKSKGVKGKERVGRRKDIKRKKGRGESIRRGGRVIYCLK